MRPLAGEGLEVWFARQPGGLEAPVDVWTGRTRYDALAITWRELCKWCRDRAARGAERA
jgi:hypothetical protein